MLTILTMRSQHEQNGMKEGSSDRELRLLSEVDRFADATQRDLSGRVGIALGLTNVLLRNLAEKGYIRVTRAGWKRWLYALTPAGFSRKVQLTMAYVHRFLGHYQTVRQTLREELRPAALHEESRVAIYGTGEFAELVYLALKEMGVEEIDILGPTSLSGGKFLGMVVRDAAELRPEEYDRVIVADLHDSKGSWKKLRELGAAPEKLVTFFSDGESGGQA